MRTNDSDMVIEGSGNDSEMVVDDSDARRTLDAPFSKEGSESRARPAGLAARPRREAAQRLAGVRTLLLPLEGQKESARSSGELAGARGLRVGLVVWLADELERE